MAITYHRMSTGEWVAHGPVSEIKIGPVDISKRSGAVCHRVIDEVAPAERGKAYGYLTEHCQPASRAAREARRKCDESRGN